MGCNSGYQDDGACLCVRWANTIWKQTYDRGVGYPKYRTYVKYSYMPGSRTAIKSFSKRTSWRNAYPMVCASNKQTDAGLCYNYCNTGYKGT